MTKRSLLVASLATGAVGLGTNGAAQDPAFHAKLLDRYEIPGDTYTDVWVDGSAAYIGRLSLNVVDVLDVSTPTSITWTTQITIPAPNNNCSAHDIKVGANALDPAVHLGFLSYEYNFGTDMFGIYDVTNPASPTLLTTVSATGYSTSHNTSYRSDGWIASCNSVDAKLALFDLSAYDPSLAPPAITAPDYEIFGLGSGFVHDITLTDDFLFVAAWDALFVYDVRNLASTAPVRVGQEEAYACHAVWPTEDNEYVVTADERHGGAVRLWKLSESGGTVSLREVDSYVAPLSGANSTYCAHNVVVSGDRAYVSNYSAGVLVLQIDRTNDTWEVVASYDTSTTPPVTYDGCWGVNPMLGADLVVTSDFGDGLHALDFSALEFRSATTRPKTIAPWETSSIQVQIEELGAATLDPATVELFTSVDGAPFTGASMAFVAGYTWQGDLPAAGCNSRIDYYFSADTGGGETFTRPAIASTEFYTTYSTLALTNVFSDDFETDKGWTVSNTSLMSGAWERATPSATGLAPGEDGDGSGMCFVTENGFAGAGVGDFDVDGGPTRLTSPMIDFSAGDGLISYWRWQGSDVGEVLSKLTVEVSNGGSWVDVEDVFNLAGGWLEHRFRVSDYVVPSSTVQVRFSIADISGSVTEAAIDGVSADLFCTSPTATFVFENGGGGNTPCFTSSACVLDSTWSNDVAYGAHPGATHTVLWMYAGAGSGTFGPYGEFLVDLSSPKLLVDVRAVTGGGVNNHSFTIPADAFYAGIPFTTQAGVLGGGVELCNAYEYVIGF